jgi:ssDNA-binding replication factor A large subunit
MPNQKINIEGKIERIFSDSGAIERCPECRRALVNDHCPVHLDVDGIEDLRVKVKLDNDMKVIFNGDLIEHILGIKKSDANALPDHDVKRIIHDKFSKKSVNVEASPISEDDQLYHVKSIQKLG